MWAENAGFAAAALWNDWQAAGIVIYGWEMKANVERYYIRTILSDRFRDSQIGPESKTCGYVCLYHIPLFSGQLYRIFACGGIFGMHGEDIQSSVPLYGKRDEVHCFPFADCSLF